MTRKEQHIDEEIKALFKANALEEAPKGFTRRVMRRIQRKSTVREETWLITPAQWIVSGILLLGFWTFSGVFQPELSGQVGLFLSGLVREIELSGTVLTCLVIFTVFLCIQIYFIHSRIVQSYERSI